jgi:hypothetical protein
LAGRRGGDRRRDRKLNSMKRGDELRSGVLQMVKVYIATKRVISVGDKMAGRHGNKGVIAKILPSKTCRSCRRHAAADHAQSAGRSQPYERGPDSGNAPGLGRAPSWASRRSRRCSTVRRRDINDCLAEAGLPAHGKVRLYDGRTGEPMEQETTVGYIYMLKLHHLVDDKVHARSTGPYSLITQQPLGGKARFGGQRFGEMEVWALEAYGAAYILQELLTVKSDDVEGRTKIYESMVKGENTLEAGTPASFDVLTNEIRGLAEHAVGKTSGRVFGTSVSPGELTGGVASVGGRLMTTPRLRIKAATTRRLARSEVRPKAVANGLSGFQRSTGMSIGESSYDRINDYASVKISLARPHDIRSWSFGEVKKPETINYRTYRPEKDGLFCERIFGPEKDWECACGKYRGMKYKGMICDRCGVKVTHSRVRRKRMGHIELAAPVVHIWFFKAMPSRLGNLLNMKTTSLEKVIYFQDYVVTSIPATRRWKSAATADRRRVPRRPRAVRRGSFEADMGAEAIRKLLMETRPGPSCPRAAPRAGRDQFEAEEEGPDQPAEDRRGDSRQRQPPEWMVLDVIPVIPPDLRPWCCSIRATSPPAT